MDRISIRSISYETNAIKIIYEVSIRDIKFFCILSSKEEQKRYIRYWMFFFEWYK